MKKIVLIRENKTKFGGAENYLLRLSDALKELKKDHQIVNSKLPRFLPSWLRIIFFNLQLCINKQTQYLYFSLDRIICADVYRAGDGVHKKFLTIEKKSRLNLLHPIYLFLEKRCFENAKLIIANSKMIRKEIIDIYGISSKKIKVIYNGIKIDNFSKKNAYSDLKTEFPIIRNKKIILFVGSGFKRKGAEDFIKYAAILSNEISNLIFFIVGKDKNTKFYEELAESLKISDKIIFTGPRGDVKNFYILSDILILPTKYEPFSNVILEAMHYENVVFTTKQNGASEILDSKFVMERPSDYSKLDLIKELIVDKKKLLEIQVENSRKAKNFSIQRNVSETLKEIEKIT